MKHHFAALSSGVFTDWVRADEVWADEVHADERRRGLRRWAQKDSRRWAPADELVSDFGRLRSPLNIKPAKENFKKH